jgi:hypothetical protein
MIKQKVLAALSSLLLRQQDNDTLNEHFAHRLDINQHKGCACCQFTSDDRQFPVTATVSVYDFEVDSGETPTETVAVRIDAEIVEEQAEPTKRLVLPGRLLDVVRSCVMDDLRRAKDDGMSEDTASLVIEAANAIGCNVDWETLDPEGV